MRDGRGQATPLQLGGFALFAVTLGVGLASADSAGAQDRVDELEGLRNRIQDSRERVTAHEAGERAVLEQLEAVDRRLSELTRDRASAGKAAKEAVARLAEIEPALALAREQHSETQRALASRAVALYRGGELGPVRVLFSATSLQGLLSRASALRVLVRHDADLVARFGEERSRLESLKVKSDEAIENRAMADEELSAAVAGLAAERKDKRRILKGLRKNRTSERQLLLELEQAAQALEETIRTLGAQSAASGGVAGAGFARRRGKLAPPVNAEIEARFGKVIDPEFQTKTFRSGIDFAAEAGSRVRAVAAGIVRFAGWFRGYGRIVIVDHGDGFHTISGHLDEIDVEVGLKISEGESLGSVGETGSLRGPSLYFELRKDGEPVDPEPWMVDPKG